MKLNIIKKLIFFLSVITFIAPVIKIDTFYILHKRLKKIDNMYMCFIQKINLNEGQIKTSRGELWIQRPNLFCWHIIDPEENFLISDGKTLWFYVPKLKHVTAYQMKDIEEEIFLKLLFGNNVSQWKNYNINQKDNWFYLTPIHLYNHLKQITIKINDCGIINRLSICDNNKQCIDYYLSNHSIKPIDIKKFNFIIPNNVQLDDQR